MHLVVEKLRCVGIGQSYLICDLCVGLPSLLLGTNELKDKLLLLCSTPASILRIARRYSDFIFSRGSSAVEPRVPEMTAEQTGFKAGLSVFWFSQHACSTTEDNNR